MTDSLFEKLPESLSPRLRWMRKFQISAKLLYVDQANRIKSLMDELGRTVKIMSYTAGKQDIIETISSTTDKYECDYCFDKIGFGDTEEEALIDYAAKMKLKTWKEMAV